MNNFNFSRYKLQKNGDDYTLILYFDHSTEFANELSNENNDNQEEQKENFIYQVKDFVFEKFPNLKVTTVKIVIGATLFSSFSINYALAETTTNTQSYSNYVVKAGDTLWKIANQYGTTVDALRSLNNLTSDVIYVGQNIKIPEKYEKVSVVLNGENKEFSPSSYLIGDITYVPVRQIAEELGASIWYNGDSRTVGINREDLSIAFVIGASSARVNGERVNMAPSKLINGTTYVPVRFIADSFGLSHRWDSNSRSVYLTSPLTTTYTVKPGDSLWLIANSFGITISALKDVNGITSDTIYVGQELRIPPKDNQVTEPTQPVTTNPPNQTYTEDTVTYTTHTVEQGDNPWNLSIEYGIPMTELLEENHLTTESVLSLGQQLTIPVHHIPVKPVISEKYGELLDWWTEAQYVFPINKTARVIDFETGRSFYVKRTIGANHSDTEPLTAQDAAIIKDIWGGEYSWDKRAVIIEVDGRRLAASMASMPHSMQFITDNNFDGHFDIHFLNSTRHKDGQMTEEHQRQVKIAAGLITP